MFVLRVAFAFLLCCVFVPPAVASPPLTVLPSLSLAYSNGECGRNACWTCDSAVDYASVSVTVDDFMDRLDAVKLASGCTGYIGELNVAQFSGDGVKVAEGAHDLVVAGGTVRCFAKRPTLHQDAFQALGGSNIRFEGVTLDCGREGESLIDSNWFVNEAGSSTFPPSGVVCDGCWLGPWAAHTVNLEDSVGSGVENSVVCPGKFPNLTFTVGSGAADPVTSGNVFPVTCQGGQ